MHLPDIVRRILGRTPPPRPNLLWAASHPGQQWGHAPHDRAERREQLWYPDLEQILRRQNESNHTVLPSR
jgi:hypothetical protein